MSENTITTAEALQLLRGTPLIEGHQWHARSMDTTFTTLNRKYSTDTGEIITWLEQEAAAEGYPLKVDFIVSGRNVPPAFRFSAGGFLSFRVVPTRL